MLISNSIKYNLKYNLEIRIELPHRLPISPDWNLRLIRHFPSLHTFPSPFLLRQVFQDLVFDEASHLGVGFRGRGEIIPSIISSPINQSTSCLLWVGEGGRLHTELETKGSLGITFDICFLIYLAVFFMTIVTITIIIITLFLIVNYFATLASV